MLAHFFVERFAVRGKRRSRRFSDYRVELVKSLVPANERSMKFSWKTKRQIWRERLVSKHSPLSWRRSAGSARRVPRTLSIPQRKQYPKRFSKFLVSFRTCYARDSLDSRVNCAQRRLTLDHTFREPIPTIRVPSTRRARTNGTNGSARASPRFTGSSIVLTFFFSYLE